MNQTMEAVTNYKDITLDRGAHCVTRAGREVPMTPREFALFETLLTHRGLVMTRSDLLAAAWGYSCSGMTRTVDVHIQRLRRKLGLEQDIKTVYRVGYLLH
ncbi:MAG: winged helix-turn-helix domain-containing protein [Gemmiger sp.]